MKKRVVVTVAFIFSLFLLNLVLAEVVSEDLHLNIQTTNTTGGVVTGTFSFVFNISTTSDCSTIIYSNSTTKTTDMRGIISYYLPNVSLNYSQQYYLCYYRDGSLKDATKIVRTPYSFRAKNITLSGVEPDSNLDASGYNITANYYFGNGTYLKDVNDTLSQLNCGNGQVVKWNDPSNVWYCSDVAPSGTGDIDAVNTVDDYLEGGQTSGTVNLSIDETKLNQTIDSRISTNNASIVNWATSTFAQIANLINLIGNWSADKPNYYNTTQIVEINTSMKNYVDFQNTSQTNYIAENNASIVNWATSTFTSLATVVAAIGNWSDDKPNYYNTTQIVEINTSVTNTINSVGSRWEANYTNMQGDCGAGYFSIGFYSNGTIQCSAGTASETDPMWTANWTNVAFENQANTFGAYNQTFDTNTLFIDSNNNAIGIGTASPTENLTVAGSVSFLGNRVMMRNFAGRQKTILLFQFPGAYTGYTTSEAFDFIIHDSVDYDTYSAMNVLINRDGTGNTQSWGQDDGNNYLVRIKTYNDSGTISVYAVTDNYVDLFTLSMRYNRDFNAFIGTEVGSDSYTPPGTLVYDSSLSTNKWTSGTPSNSSTLTMMGGKVGIGTSSPQRPLHVAGNILANGTINATTDVCIEGGNCLSGVITTGGETDPKWSANYTAYNESWSSTYNATTNASINNYIVYTNGTMKSYVDATDLAINTSNNNYILWVNSTNGVGSGAYNDTWINTTFYNTTQIVEINTSMQNYVIYTNGTMKSYVDAVDLAINTSNNNYILVVNGTMKDYVDAVNLAINESNNNYIAQNNQSVNNYINAVGSRWEANYTNMQGDCGAGSYAIGVFPNGTVQCSLDSTASESDPYWAANWTAFNESWSTTTNTSYVPYTGANKNIDLGNNNFTVNGTTLFVNTNNGRVSMGGDFPSASTAHKLFVNGTVGGVQIGNAFNYAGTSFLDLSVGSTTGNSRFLFGQSNSNYGGMIWNYNANPALAYLSIFSRTSSYPIMYFMYDGNVGIGTASPFSSTKLHVNGSILANGTINATTDVCIEGGTCLSAKLNLSGGTMTGNLNLSANVNLTMNGGNQIGSNVTCVIIKGMTSTLEIC